MKLAWQEVEERAADKSKWHQCVWPNVSLMWAQLICQGVQVQNTEMPPLQTFKRALKTELFHRSYDNAHLQQQQN